MCSRKNISASKNFGQYRAHLVSAPGGNRVLITDTKACGRVVVKLEALDGLACLESVTPEAIEKMVGVIKSPAETIQFAKQQLALSVSSYIYGTIDLIDSIEWFNPIAARATAL